MKFAQFALSVALAAIVTPAVGVPTPVTVRVLSQGAKFVGSGMGGVGVVLADATTGAVLAEGRIEGGTGDTAKIMPGSPRGTPMADANSAAFNATLDIAEPRQVQVTVRGPLKPEGAAVTLTTTRWLIPGQPVAGDGWVVELPGLALTARREGAQVVADVSMLCGCPIANGTLWDQNRFRLNAWVDGTAYPLAFAGQTGRFAADIPEGATWVTALDKLTGASSATKLTPYHP